MLCDNVIFEIFSFLDLKNLNVVAAVNKKFRKIALRPVLYKKEFLRIFFIGCGDGISFCDTWVSVARTMGVFAGMLGGNEFLPYGKVFEWICLQLSMPQIPLPKLRKDAISYNTTYQNIFAYFILDNSAIRKKNLNFTQDPETSKKFSKKIPFFSSFSILVKTYCQGIQLQLSESEEILETYLKLWEKFSFSSENILDEIFNFFSNEDLENFPEISEFFLRLPSTLTGIWTETVFFALWERLSKQFFQEFCEGFSGNNEKLELCRRFCEALVDLSINEVNVHFIDHSKLDLGGPAKVLEDFVSLNWKKIVKNEEVESVLNVFYNGAAKRLLNKFCCGWKDLLCWRMQDLIVEQKSKKKIKSFELSEDYLKSILKA